jgi:hypothetical protein
MLAEVNSGQRAAMSKSLTVTGNALPAHVPTEFDDVSPDGERMTILTCGCGYFHPLDRSDPGVTELCARHAAQARNAGQVAAVA